MEFGKVLQGVKVVELATYAAAPGVGRMLADWGADVIKIESPNSDPVRAYSASMGMPSSDDENPIWQLENGNKKGISLNLRNPDGMKVLHRLLSDADVFITNNRLGALKKMKLDYDTLCVQYPKLVWGHISGLGAEGEEANKPGFDITAYWARSGALIDLVQPEQPPIFSPPAAGDHSVSLALAAGICAALVKQRMTGKGDRVAVSLLGTAIWGYGFMLMSTQYGDIYPKSRSAPQHPMNTSYCCADGEWIMLSVIEYERYYNSMCNILGLQEFIGDERYCTRAAVVEHKAEFMDIMAEAFRKQDRAYWYAKLQEADIACEVIRHFKDLSSDPQGWANSNLVRFKFDSGNEAVLPCSPVQFSTNVAPPCKRAPRLGEHTDEILQNVGYTEAEIAALHGSGAVFTKV